MEKDYCEWAQQDADFNDYGTGCQHLFTLFDGTPEENNFKFCPFCGKPLESVPVEQEESEARNED